MKEFIFKTIKRTFKKIARTAKKLTIKSWYWRAAGFYWSVMDNQLQDREKRVAIGKSIIADAAEIMGTDSTRESLYRAFGVFPGTSDNACPKYGMVDSETLFDLYLINTDELETMETLFNILQYGYQG